MISLVLVMAIAPVAAQVAVETTTLSETSIAIEAETVTDAAIAARIRAVLQALDGYSRVEVEVESGVVTVSGEALDEAAVQRLYQIVRRVDGVVAVNSRVRASTNLAERLAPIQGRFLARLWQTVSYLPLLGVALIAFLLIYALGQLVSRIAPLWNRLAPNGFIAGIYAQLAQLLFALAGLVVALDILGATALLGSILGAAGIIGLAFGFAVRDTVENFVASVMLSIRQPFEPFELIEVDGDIGKVVRLTSRATILLSPDGNLISVPNAIVFKKRLLNYTRNPERRFSFKLDADPSADIARLRTALEARLAALPFVLAEPAPHVVVHEDTGAAVRLGFGAWIDQRQTNWEQSRGEAIRVLRAEMARLIKLVPACQGAQAQLEVSLADLDPDAMPDLANTEERDLERMVAAERQTPQTSDLLKVNAPKE
ncbi:MAG: BON domain-containing protein [Cyanobium sp. PLM2.Bin73]|nr:MAG: BON domain-containing protein [Cyanobium sp. PLM2.Bin73]